MENSSNTLPKIIKPVVILLRIVAGLTFLFSGFVKAIDPVGSSIKFQEYFVGLGIDILSPSSILGPDFVSTFAILLGVLLAAGEFTLGCTLLFGLYRKLSPWLFFLFMLVMTPLTLYLAIANPVHDCGCFGEAIVITNWQTFYKNLFLFVASIFLLKYNHWCNAVFIKSIRWLPALFSLLYALMVSALSYMYQPLLDFRPYKSGINLREAVQSSDVAAEYVFIYEKEGVEEEFDINNIPYSDTTWHFVERIEKIADASSENESLDFTIYDGDEDITDFILEDENYSFLLLVPSVNEYDDSWDDKIFNLYDYAYEHSYNFFALSPDESAMQEELEASGITFPCYTMDETVIEMIARGNPAVAMLKDGSIHWKISPRELLDVSQYSEDIESTPLAELHKYNFAKRFSLLMAIYIIPLVLLYLCEKGVVRILASLRQRRETEKLNGEAENKESNQAEVAEEEKETENNIEIADK